MNASPAPRAPSATRIARYDTVIIGAGQAGLAAGHHLAGRDVDFIILDAAPRIGDSWRNRWDSLRLFTPAAFSGLPGMPFPAPPMHLPDKDEAANYLERYAERFELPVQASTRVASLTRDGRRYVVHTDRVRYEANNVVVATGPFQTPRVPTIASRLSPRIHQIHSSQYTNPFTLPPGPVLVVGAGNSGAQIALEPARFRKGDVCLAGRTTGQIPRTFLGRDLYKWIWPILRRLTATTVLGQRLRDRTRRGDPLIGLAPSSLSDAGIRRVGRVTDVDGGMPVCDGQPIDAAVVIWCTGFAPNFSWVRVPLPKDNGIPRTARGVVPESPGLYFVGLRFQHRLTSALMGGVGDDAAYIADQILRRDY